MNWDSEGHFPLVGGSPTFRGRSIRLGKIIGMFAPKNLKGAKGRSPGPKRKGDLTYKNSGLISFEWNENLEWYAGEAGGMSGVILLSSVVLEEAK